MLIISHMKRKNGFYWVKLQGEWIVSEWYDESCWLLPGNESTFDDNYFDEINEKKLELADGK